MHKGIEYLRAMARSLDIAGEPGGLLGDIIPDIAGSNVCFTVILCLKSDGKLIFVLGSFFKSFSLDLLNFPKRKILHNVYNFIKPMVNQVNKKNNYILLRVMQNSIRGV